MYKFNSTLFRRLYLILRIRRRDLIETIGTTPTTFDYWYKTADLPIDKLIEICNKYHIPVSHFVVVGDDAINSVCQQTKEHYVIDEPWEDITLNLGKMGDLLLSKGKVHEVCDIIGCSTAMFYKYFRCKSGQTPLRICQFIKYVNKAQLYAGDFLVDNNRPIVVDKLVKKEVDAVTEKNRILVSQLRNALMEIDQLRKENQKLSEQVVSLLSVT